MKKEKIIKLLILGIILGSGGYFLKSNSNKNSLEKQQIENINKNIPQNNAVLVNGKGIDKEFIKIQFSNITNQYREIINNGFNENNFKVYIFNELLNRTLAQDLALNLGISITDKEIETSYNHIKNQFSSENEFLTNLKAQGFNEINFKDSLKSNLAIDKINTKIKKDYFQNNNSKEVDNLIAKKYSHLLNKEKEKMKLVILDNEFSQYIEKIEETKNSFAITNLDKIKASINIIGVFNGNYEKISQVVDSFFEKNTKLAEISKKYGVIIDDSLPLDQKFSVYESGLLEKIKATVDTNETILKEFFEENSLKYDQFPTADAEISALLLQPSQKDWEKAYTKTNLIFVNLEKENFKEVAEKESEDIGSGKNGGDLGWFGKGAMVKEFEEAAFSGEIGKIYPNIVKTQFGYHIIYIEDRNDNQVKASHILVKPVIEKETVETEIAYLKSLSNDIKEGKLKFKDLEKNERLQLSKTFTKIGNSGYIDEIGQLEYLPQRIFSSKLNEATVVVEDQYIYLFNKIAETKYIEANYEDVKTQLEKDYREDKAQEIFSEIKESIENNKNIKS